MFHTERGKEMFYTVSEDSGVIMFASSTCPDPQEEADLFGCAVYIIEGEHTGLTAVPETPDAT